MGNASENHPKARRRFSLTFASIDDDKTLFFGLRFHHPVARRFDLFHFLSVAGIHFIGHGGTYRLTIHCQIDQVRPAGACFMTGEKGMRYGKRPSLKRSRPRDRDRIGRPQPLVRRHREGRVTARGDTLISASRETCQQTRL